jgi:hypothetical protein
VCVHASDRNVGCCARIRRDWRLPREESERKAELAGHGPELATRDITGGVDDDEEAGNVDDDDEYDSEDNDEEDEDDVEEYAGEGNEDDDDADPLTRSDIRTKSSNSSSHKYSNSLIRTLVDRSRRGRKRPGGAYEEE